jgi:hypothetical protein
VKNIVCYKIENAYVVPYKDVLDKDKMSRLEESTEIIRSSRIYFICKRNRRGLFQKQFREPEVLYVGETFDKKNRFSGHTKLLKATTMLKKSENLFVYFLEMRFHYADLTPPYNNGFHVVEQIGNIDSKSPIRVIERAFIKLFDPILNKAHKNTPLSQDNLVQEILVKNQIGQISIDLGMKNPSFLFRGGNRADNIDWYTIDLSNDQLRTGPPNIHA